MLRLLALCSLLLLAACAPRQLAPLTDPASGAFGTTEEAQPAEDGTVDAEADVEVIEAEVEEEDPVEGEEEPEPPRP